jgi:uncharacterized protein YdaU (DUF1376 family)
VSRKKKRLQCRTGRRERVSAIKRRAGACVNFYKRFMGDYAKDTAHLSLVEHGAYTVLLDTQYATERGLPGAMPDLYRICRAMGKPEQAAVDRVAAEFFPLCEDGLRWNGRAHDELVDAAPRIDAARENGKKGGRPKAKTHKKPAGLSAETHDEPNSKASQSQNQNQSTPSLRSGVGGACALLPGVPESLVADYLEVRRAKKAGAFTKTAVAGLHREAERAGVSIERALQACCEFSWIGFNAKWFAERQQQAQAQGRGETVYQQSQRERVAEFAPGVAKRPGAIDVESTNVAAITSH